MVPGMVMMWPYSVATIPSGWHLCDGTAGTVDLRDYFLICTREDDAGVGKAFIRGGLKEKFDTTTHTHNFTGDGHAHDLASGDNILDSTPAGYRYHGTTVSPATGTTNSQYSEPKCKAVCFIQKL